MGEAKPKAFTETGYVDVAPRSRTSPPSDVRPHSTQFAPVAAARLATSPQAGRDVSVMTSRQRLVCVDTACCLAHLSSLAYLRTTPACDELQAIIRLNFIALLLFTVACEALDSLWSKRVDFRPTWPISGDSLVTHPTLLVSKIYLSIRLLEVASLYRWRHLASFSAGDFIFLTAAPLVAVASQVSVCMWRLLVSRRDATMTRHPDVITSYLHAIANGDVTTTSGQTTYYENVA